METLDALVRSSLKPSYLGGNNPTIADVILDRLVTGAERVVIKGNKSMRATRKTKKAHA